MGFRPGEPSPPEASHACPPVWRCLPVRHQGRRTPGRPRPHARPSPIGCGEGDRPCRLCPGSPCRPAVVAGLGEIVDGAVLACGPDVMEAPTRVGEAHGRRPWTGRFRRSTGSPPTTPSSQTRRRASLIATPGGTTSTASTSAAGVRFRAVRREGARSRGAARRARRTRPRMSTGSGTGIRLMSTAHRQGRRLRPGRVRHHRSPRPVSWCDRCVSATGSPYFLRGCPGSQAGQESKLCGAGQRTGFRLKGERPPTRAGQLRTVRSEHQARTSR
jgi:hypothetical protein